MRLRIIVFSCVSALLPLGACIHAGPAGDPVSRKLSWLDYVVAEGLRGACAPRTYTQLRPIYNGTSYNGPSNKQARIYDLLEPSSGRGAKAFRKATPVSQQDDDPA